MDGLKQNADNASQQQQSASEQLQQGKNKKASQSQQNASQEMQKMMDKISSMQAQMSGTGSAEDLDNLRDILENLVQLSFDQEDLMDELKETSATDPRYVELTQKQKNLADDSKMIEDSLFALSKRVIQIQSTVNKEISSINMNMDKALSNLAERETSQALSRQQYIMTSVNNLALLLDDVVQQMMQQMAQQKPGMGSCKKPGGNGKPKPGAASMKQLQQQLQQQLEQMQKAMQQGKKPGNMPGNLPGNQQMSEQLAKMAAQQAYIREQMRKLSEQMKGDGGGKGLDGLNKMLEENQKDMVNNNITPETIERQHKIITRLLEAEKAERKERI